MSDDVIERIYNLSPKSGDIIVIQTNNIEAVKSIRGRFDLPDNVQILVMDTGTDVTVLDEEMMLTAGWARIEESEEE